MSAKAISEQTGKEFLYKYICTTAAVQNRFRYATATAETDWERLTQDHPWLLTERLVVKPDQLIKRRGKLGLVGVDLDLQGVREWLKPRLMRETTVGKAKGVLKNFLIEPFVPHSQEEEFYTCIYATREGDYVLFHHEGGVEVGDVDSKALRLLVGVDEKLTEDAVTEQLLVHVPDEKKEVLASFIVGLFNLYEDLYFTYLEINPLVVNGEGVYVLDMAAKIDATADFICKPKWGDVEFPPPFGREAYPEEAYIADLDAKSGASLKLTLLNPRGRIWTMVAGGGASVVYSDTICDLGGVDELANYGEYSGAPSEQQTYDYAKTILSLMTCEKHPDGKVLIIGGSIANFTNVAATFKGIVRAIKDFQGPLKEHEVTIFVRRGGPNYQEGLRVMGEVGKTTGIPIHVFGTETHMTAIVGMALGHRPIPNQPPVAAHTANFLLNSSSSAAVSVCVCVSVFLQYEYVWYRDMNKCRCRPALHWSDVGSKCLPPTLERARPINNPDMRVQILKDFVKQHFPATQLLDYALDVEKITTSKKPNLILNVDGFIGVAFVDLLRTCGGFTRDEADEFVEIGALNGIFVLGRSMGFIGHYLDQKRLKQGLYRHPWDDISYVLPEHMSM
ncbi:ATP-citrate synthase [Salminus brasiliensis]|uniref:ATP-citrate synthase n=1 Tax=Salminus brasiliensis TaxID=930266 RepID=UPI003B83023A